MGSIVLQTEIGSIVLQILQNHGINDNAQTPMTLKMAEVCGSRTYQRPR